MTSTPTDVTQADRDAAAEYMRLFPDLRLPEAFAKHRLAHRPCDETVAALQALFDSYKDLADSGDSGFWCLEDQPVGKQALAALKSARERHRLAHQPGDGALQGDLAAIGLRPPGKVLAWADPRPCFYVNSIDGCGHCIGCKQRLARAAKKEPSDAR